MTDITGRVSIVQSIHELTRQITGNGLLSDTGHLEYEIYRAIPDMVSSYFRVSEDQLVIFSNVLAEIVFGNVNFLEARKFALDQFEIFSAIIQDSENTEGGYLDDKAMNIYTESKKNLLSALQNIGVDQSMLGTFFEIIDAVVVG